MSRATQSHFKKMQNLQEEIQVLHKEMEETQKQLAQNFVDLIPQTEAFSIPPHVLIGGILHTIHTYKTTPGQTEAWQKAGELFLKKHSKNQPRRQEKAA